MHTEKYGMGNCGLLLEADRSLYKNADTTSKSIIDHDKTHLNYNLCPHAQYKAWELKAMHEKIRGKKMPKNGVAFGCTVITLPKDYGGDPKEFFKTAYEGMKDTYGLTDEDVISAYVHMDETTPHMHFNFLPIIHDFGKDRISWESVMPRRMYKTQHKILQKYMSEKLHTEVNLLNGKTLGFDPQKMTAEQKQESMELSDTIEQKQATLASLDSQIATKKKMWENIAETILKPYIEAQERLIELFKALKPKEQAKEQESVYNVLESGNDMFNKGNPNDIAKATTAMKEKSDDLEATYLSIDDDDDFER